MVGLGSICQQSVFAARPEYLSLTYVSLHEQLPKVQSTTCLHIPITPGTKHCGRDRSAPIKNLRLIHLGHSADFQ